MTATAQAIQPIARAVMHLDTQQLDMPALHAGATVIECSGCRRVSLPVSAAELLQTRQALLENRVFCDICSE